MPEVGRQIEIIGVPFNSAGTTDGVARAPVALRRAGLSAALRRTGADVVDSGDLELGPTSPTRDPRSRVIAPAALARMIREVRSTVRRSMRGGRFPLVIGGDCPVLLGCMNRPGEDSLGVLFVDGHEDAWPPELSPTGEAADMELGFALGLTVSGLPRELVAELPRIGAADVVVLGARDDRELARAGVPSIAAIAQVLRPEAIAADPARVGVEAAGRLATRGRWWFHVDLDVLSTESLSAVDYPQAGGLDWSALTRLSREALRTPGVMGWDVTIFNPDLDPEGTHAKRIVRYVADSLGGP
jgi:arginase